MGLVIIYRFESSQNQDEFFRSASYEVVYLFTKDGFIEDSKIREIIQTMPVAQNQTTRFQSLDELKEFALKLAIDLGIKDVRLISIQDYNIGLDGARDVKGLHELFSQFGELIINEEASKKKNFLGKLFT